MTSKAISPMIATILLIAFTVAVGGIISIWMTGYTRTTGASVSAATNDTVACVGTYPNIVTVTSSAIVVTNPGAETISSLACYWGNSSNVTGLGTLSLAAGVTTSASYAHATGETSVVCTGKCKTIGVSGECKLGQSCWIS